MAMALARRQGLASLPSAVMPPKLFARSLVNARATLVRPPPLQPPPKGFQRGPCPPDATTPAAFDSRPSAALRPKFLAQSLVHLSCSVPACATLSAAAKRLPARPVPVPPRPRRRPSPAALLPSCAENFFCPISRKLPCISLNSAHTCATPSTAADRLPARPVPSPRRDAGGLRLPPTTPGGGGPDPGPTPENGRQPGRVAAAADPLLLSTRLHLNQDAI